MLYPEPLAYFILLNTAIFGALVGSFLNVCIYRLPKEYISIVFPASHCTYCGTHLAWYDNIPILSWLSLGGACRYCRSPIRIRYPFIEALTSVFFIICAYFVLLSPMPMSTFASLEVNQRWIALVFTLYMTGLLIVITFIDIDFRIIPHCLNYPGIVIAPLFSAFFPVFHRPLPFVIENPHLAGLISSFLGIIVGGGALHFVGVIGKVLFQKDAMGGGDVRMMAMVGGFLGWDSALLIFFIACICGTVLGIIWLMITRDHYIPFGPYLAMGTFISLLFKDELLYWVFTVWPQIVSQWMRPASMTF